MANGGQKIVVIKYTFGPNDILSTCQGTDVEGIGAHKKILTIASL
jgi:hypothetical protein